ncbi:MAG: ferredoxin, partial [Pseudomonadota bacterium]
MTGAVWTEIAAGARAAGFDAAPLRPAAGETGSGETGDEVAAVVMLGTLGPRTWAAFQASPEAEDGAPDPLDRWSRRQAQALAKRFGGAPCLPNDGPPWAPFLRWAARAEPVWPSRLGMTLHARKGLWTSWRAALLLPVWPEGAPPPPAPVPRPCDPCAAPCLSACPVGAFAETTDGPRYDAEACAAHLRRPEGAECRDRGCLARRACPVGRAYAPTPAQGAFH